MRVYLIQFIIAITFYGSSWSQSAAEFREAANLALETYDTPGFAVGIIKEGEVILSEGFGTRTIHHDEVADGNTLFAIASNTKAFISTAIVKLHEEGKLDIDAPVQQYLPYFQLYDEYVSQHTTVRDLLCHRVGLGTYSGDALWYKTEKSPEQIIKQIMHLPQAYEWRGGYGYTNLMFIAAGEVIKSVTGKTWDEYIQTNFLTPLNMSRTQTSVDPLSDLSNVATPHVTYRNNLPIPMAQWNTPGAAGGIISSTNDMLKWLDIQLYPDRAEESGVFPSVTTSTTMKPHTPIGRLNFYSAGLGWFLYRHGGQAIVTHGGGYDGMYSRVIMIPEKHVGIVVLTNSMTGLSSNLAAFIRDKYLGLDTEGWLDNAKEGDKKSRIDWNAKFVKSTKNRIFDTQPSLQMEALTGTYFDPLYGEVRIIQNAGNQLELEFVGAPELSAILKHWHFDTYEIEWKQEHAWFDFGTVQFLIDNNRNITELQFDVPNDDIFFNEIHPLRVKE